MSKEVDYYFDVGSPAAYLSWTQMPKLVEETGAKVNYKPVLLGGIFKATGNSAPIAVPAKGKWLWADLNRWAKLYNVPFKMNDKFPVNTLILMRGLTAYQNDAKFIDLGNAIFDGMWASNKDLTEMDVVAQVVTSAGIDAAEFAAKVEEAAIKQTLIDQTDEAIAKGAFGSPSFVVDDELHFGQDRMHFVKDALMG